MQFKTHLFIEYFDTDVCELFCHFVDLTIKKQDNIFMPVLK